MDVLKWFQKKYPGHQVIKWTKAGVCGEPFRSSCGHGGSFIQAFAGRVLIAVVCGYCGGDQLSHFYLNGIAEPH